MPNPPHTAVERFAAIRLALAQFVAAQTGWGLALPLIALIGTRLRIIGQRFARLAARIEAGIYVPRRRPAGPPRRTTERRPRRPSELPTRFAWLLSLVPGTAGFGSQLENLFRDPEMVALMQAAPDAMGRPLRSLCHMLGVRPPPILAPPRRARAAARPKGAPSAKPVQPPRPAFPPGHVLFPPLRASIVHPGGRPRRRTA